MRPMLPEEEELRTMPGPPGPPSGQMPMPDTMNEMAPPGGIPEQATVEGIEGNTVHVKTAQGQSLKIPIDAFVFPPEPGMKLVKAEVVEVREDVMVIMVAEAPIEVPVIEGFNEGEFIWLPEPPTSPEGLHGSEPVL
jgi:hypothetical protein